MYGVRICSFHDADGEVTANGKVYRFEFSKMFGPLLVGKTGKVLENQNPPKAFWRAFEDWYEAKYGPLPHREEERETQRMIADGRLVQMGRYLFPRTLLDKLKDECCDHCKLPDGEGCAYPQYGVAPHDCGGFDKIGTARTLPRSEWPLNFIEDPETPSVEGKYPGCGIYCCPVCGHGKAAESSEDANVG